MRASWQVPLYVWGSEDLFKVEPVALAGHPLVQRACKQCKAALPLLHLRLDGRHVARASDCTHCHLREMQRGLYSTFWNH
jgi:hypothetical protein